MYEGMFGVKEKPPILVVVGSLLCCLISFSLQNSVRLKSVNLYDLTDLNNQQCWRFCFEVISKYSV